MTRPFEHLKAEVLGRSSEERADLAHSLIASLDDEPEEDLAEVEAAWEAEIARRLGEFRSGAVQAVPAVEVFAEARARLQ
ncbi:MAG TPA: addiction module protein [Longimicrobium sp.]|nr:addiction module protein [Longimicrobium sp.]